MKTKKIIFIVFVFVALVQIFVPAKMIFDSENVLNSGKEFKFKCRPIDPNDFFRGKYIILDFAENKFITNDKISWERDENIYLHYTLDSLGFAKIKSVSKEKPSADIDFVKAKVNYVSENFSMGKDLNITYPFNKFYMEENKAKPAETAYHQALRDTSQTTYALVMIKDGNAVVKDVILNGKSIKEVDSK